MSGGPVDNEEYVYNGEYVKVFANVEGNDDFVVVESYEGGLEVARKSALQKKEDTYAYKRAQEQKEEIESITREARKNLDELTEKLVDKALKSLSGRIRLNALLGDGSNMAWVGVVVQELEKLVREEAPEVIKGEKGKFL